MTTLLHKGEYASAASAASAASSDLRWYVKYLRRGAVDLSLTPPIHGLLRCQDTGGIDPIDASSTEQWTTRLQQLFEGYLQTNKDAFKVRLLDELGQEQVRVEARSDSFHVFAKDELEDKSGRYYYQEAIALSDGQCFISSLDLNVNSGVVEIPHRPIVRVATPIWFNGRVRGVIVVSHSPIDLLGRLQSSKRGQLILAGSHGTYLHHQDETKQWADQLGGDASVYRDWPALKQDAREQSDGLTTEGDRVLAWTKVFLNPENPESYWLLGLDWDQGELMMAGRRVSRHIASACLGVGAIALVVAILMASWWSRPITKLAAAVDRMGLGDFDVRVPSTRRDELGAVGRAFNAMAEMVSKNTANLEAIVRLRTKELEMQKFALDQHAIVSIADIRGNITYANDKFCEVSGYSQQELLGQNHRIVKSDEHPPELYRDLWRTISSGKVWRGELRNKRKNGSFYWVSVTIVPFKNEQGKITQYVAIRKDITQRKEAEARLTLYAEELMGQKEETEAMNEELLDMNERLEKAQEEAIRASNVKSEFLANMSHEIRTPMTAILGYSENILDGDVPQDETLDAVKVIHENGQYLVHLINNILDISKIEANMVTVEKMSFSPCDIVADVVSLMHARADQQGITLSSEYAGSIPETIKSDPTRLRQILINVFGNALKFTRKGSVRLVTRFVPNDLDPRLEFDVIDTGIGMTEESVDRLFQPFTQADSSITREFGGSGLGLTISKRLAGLLGGDVTIVESRPDCGTHLRVTIATGSVDGVRMIEHTTRPAVAERVDGPTEPNDVQLLDCRILLAEDHAHNRRLIASLFQQAGADVVEVENGQLAVEAALAARGEGSPFDLILMDMQMPVLDGYSATARLRQQDYTGPIIALTAHAMSADRQKCIESGCDDFATKPIDKKKLLELIRTHTKSVSMT